MTSEEEALWRKVTRDVDPIRSTKPPRLNNPPLVSSKKMSALVKRHEGPSPTSPAPHSTSRSTHNDTLLNTATPHRNSGSQSSGKLPHPFVAGDPKMDRLAGRGRMAIDAVLDLHGHTQRTARPVLHRFIAEGHARGARCLLVITGKGLAQGDDRMGRGILRAKFYDWLDDEAVRRYVSRASRANDKHGGGGAFYVFLKARNA